MRKKMLISVAIILIMLLNCIAPVLKVAADTDVSILLERNLYTALKAELERQGVKAIYNDAQRTLLINEEEIAKVTTLSLSNSGLTDLTGLEIFTNLNSLDLSSNELNKDSNLEVLNSFNLTSLDLSSNEIEDLSMVSNINNITNLNLHNQKFNVVEIIDVDTTEESNQYEGIVYPLPKILTQFVDYIEPEWLIEKNYSNNTTETRTGTPYIDWSKFDHENLKVIYATKTEVSYQVRYGMVKVSIKVTDSTNTLYNSDINLYFVVADSDERGIYIKDPNMYKAIKSQLTKGQTENAELISYGTGAGSRNIYNRYFDEPQVLVISIDDIINKIGSLKLSNKRIRDLTGIEKFVGLELELDLSGNYIKSIDKLIELEENQVKEEALLRERVKKQIALISEVISQIDSIRAEIESTSKALSAANEEWAKLDAQRKELNAQLNELNSQKTEASSKIQTLETEIESLNESLPALQEKVDSLNKELEEAATKQKELNDQLQQLEKQIADLEAQDKSAVDEINSKKAELEKVKEQIASLQTDIANKQEEINNVNTEYSQVQQDIAAANETIAIYRTKLTDINVEIEKVKEELENVNAAIDAQVLAELFESEVTSESTIENKRASYKTAIYAAIDADTAITDANVKTAAKATLSTRVDLIVDAYKNKNAKIQEMCVQLRTLTNSSERTSAIGSILDEVQTMYGETTKNINDTLSNLETTVPSISQSTLTAINQIFKPDITAFNNDSFGTFRTLAERVLDTVNSNPDSVNTNSVLQKLQEEKTALEEEIQKLQSNISEKLTSDKTSLEAEIEKLKGEKASMEQKKTELENSIPTLEAEIKSLESNYEANGHQDEIENLRSQIDNIKNVQIPSLQSTIDIIKNNISVAEKNLTDVKDEISKKETELKEAQSKLDEVTKNIEAKKEEIKKLAEDMNSKAGTIAELQLKIAELEKELARLEVILDTRMKKLYTIYNRVDRLTAYAVVGLREITDEEFFDLGFEDAKSLFNSQVSKISSIEDYLTPFEYKYLVKTYNIPLTVTTEVDKVVVNDDGTTSTVKETQTKEIDHPISKYFSELATDEWTLSEYKTWLNNFRRDDIYFAMYAYCYYTRYFTNTTDCVANGYADYIIKRLKIDRESTTRYEEAKEQYPKVLQDLGVDCSGQATSGLLYNYAKRTVLATDEEVNTYVFLPRLKVLNVRENLIENIDKLDQLTKLVEFYAGDNEIVDISNVNWESVNEHLKVLDLSMNDISNIEPLEVLSNIVELDLSRNLIAGELTFRIDKLEDLESLDLSYNQITDIQSLINYLKYEARAYGYDGDVASFLRRPDTFNINIQYQQLAMTVDGTFNIGGVSRVELPKIFRQIEEIDYAATSFEIDSLRGNVTSDGKEAILDTASEGKHVAVVSIGNTKPSVTSIGYGTVCEITYRVGTANMLTVTVTPGEVTVEPGKTQQFEATVEGENVQYDGVKWSVSGNNSENTTVSETGLLTVAEDETATSIEVVATSVYDSTAYGKAVVTVKKDETTDPTEPAEIKVTVTPNDASVEQGKTQQFTATVEGTEDKTVDWSISGNNKENTNISETGLLTVAEDEDATKVEVTATSKADSNAIAKVEVTITEKQTVTPPDSGEDDEKDPQKPDDNNPSADITLGYAIDDDNDYMVGVQTKTPISDFKSIVLNGNTDYVAVVVPAENSNSSEEITSGYIATGMFVQIQDKDGNVVKNENGNLLVYEIVVKGDVNGDGYADSIDSILIKAYRNEVERLSGSTLKAADINNDKSVDISDSKLLLYHRAEVKGYNLDYTK